MNRNSEFNFAQLPNIDIKRSTSTRNSGLKTTFNAADLIPIYVDEVLPGDTFNITQSNIVRMTTPIHPVMDNAFIDTFYFFVPNRLVWDHWEEFCGENNTTHWTQPTEYQIPQLTSPIEENENDPGFEHKSIADYMGLPPDEGSMSVNHLPFRAYCLIWNEWFRDQNLQDPCYINKGDATTPGTLIPKKSDYTSNPNEYYEAYITNAQGGGGLLKSNKIHDYFTSALPQPQKGEDVKLPLGAIAPVLTGEEWNEYQIPTSILEEQNPLKWRTTPGYEELTSAANLKTNATGGTIVETDELPQYPITVTPSNLYADLKYATAATINELRQAFAIQKLLERDARGGTRYTEMIRSHFGVTSPDSRMQRPEYLGGTRTPIGMDQVLQTSQTDLTPQGNTAAFSLTGANEHMFTKSFTEHGYIIGLVTVRTQHTYQNGIEKMWSRKNRFDFYYPALANIGEQAILNKELYFSSYKGHNDEVFGYQEAWAEYRYKPSRVSGAMRSTYDQSLDIWHYADYYKTYPKLSNEWIQETAVNIDRTLAIPSSLEDQFIADFAFKVKTTRPMPVYSIPGLLDHN